MKRFQTSLLTLLSATLLCVTAGAQLDAAPKKGEKEKTAGGYTINFDNVSIKEFLKFISKVGGVNVIYNEEDLNFNVTIISEEPTDFDNIMSALVQVLRINGLSLIEEEKNLLIHKNEDVRQIPTVVSSENPLKGGSRPAIMTKVFKITKGNPSHIASLISPMLSHDAMVEVSMETMQLIITDVSTSIQTIEDLLLSLDAPQTPYDVESFMALNIPVNDLADLARKILTPISDNTVLEIVAQPATQTIYIVSTPFLIDRALGVLKDLDKESMSTAQNKSLSSENVLIYKLQSKSAEEIEESLKRLALEAENQGFISTHLTTTITSMKYIKSTNSVMFVGPSTELKVIDSFLKNIEASSGEKVAAGGPSNIFLYEPKGMQLSEAMNSLSSIVDHLEKTHYANPALLTALHGAQPITPINSILFTGSAQTLAELKTLLSSIEGSYESEIKHSGPTEFYIYNIKQANEEQIRLSLNHLADYLESNHFPNPDLIKAIDSMRWIKSTNSILFTGHSKALRELAELLPSFDVPPEASRSNLTQISPSSEFILYSPKHMSSSELKTLIEETGRNLKSADLADPAFLKTLESVKMLPSSDQLIFTGDKASLHRLTTVIHELDQKTVQDISNDGPYFIHLKFSDYDKVKNTLDSLSAELPKESAMRKMIEHMKFLPDTNVLVFRGPQESMKRIKEVIDLTDVADRNAGAQVVFVQVHNKPAAVIVSMLHSTGERLAKSGNAPDTLVQTLSEAEAMPHSNTIILNGTPANIQKAKELITSSDALEKQKPINESLNGPFFVHLKFADIDKVRNALNRLAEDLPKNDPIREMIRSMNFLPDTNVLVFRGPATAMHQIKEVIDLADTEHVTKRAGSEVVFINVEHRQAVEMVKILHETAEKLQKAGSSQKSLIETLFSAESTANSNTVIVSGTPENIVKVKQLITDNDTEQKGIPAASSEVYVYRLRYLTASELQTALLGIGQHADTQNPSQDTMSLIKAIESMRQIPDSNAVQFVAAPKTVEKLKEIVLILDTPENTRSQVKQHLGTNFLVYKVKNLGHQELLSHLKQIGQDAKASDPVLIKTIQSAKFAAGSNSIIFTGPKPELDKIQTLLDQLDVSTMPSAPISNRQAEGYKLYKPQYVTGTELIQMVKNFEGHLVASGVTNNGLSEAIDHLTFVNRTNTIIVTGKDTEVNEVMTLLAQFDNPSARHKEEKTPEIETIEDTGFLIYKLQYQAGEGIVNALSLISRDLTNQKSVKKNEALIEAIQSVQWIEPTNSLLATGDPKVLSRLRELMESIDRPQKQVFIEILVIESTNTDDLEFGLRWGSQGAVSDKFSWGSGNYSPTDGSAGFPLNFNQITGTRVPTGSDIPPIEGGFMGVIGDIIWHKGKSYAALGSLLNALKTEATTTVVLSQKIITQDNQNAKIFSGSNVPFTGSLVTTSGLSQTTNANLEYRNIGVTLSITPIIGDNNTVTLEIDEEISEEANSGTTTSSNVTSNSLNGITTTKTSMSTRVLMPDRHFLILSGTMRNSVTRSVSGIPCLGGLPLVGAAFSSTQKQTETANVIIFVKPHIIDSPATYARVTKQQEAIFDTKEQANTEDFERGLELIRSPDDEDDEPEQA